jgi:hypothetical protein
MSRVNVDSDQPPHPLTRPKNPQEIAEVEFKNPDGAGLDHQPSVYILNAATDDEARALTVRVRSEHSASFLSPPKPAGTLEVELEGALEGDPVVSAGETRFQFANAAHAELRLRDDAAVVQLVQRVLDQLPTRAIRVSLRDILEYVDQRLVANDPEWIAVAGSPTPCKSASTAVHRCFKAPGMSGQRRLPQLAGLVDLHRPLSPLRACQLLVAGKAGNCSSRFQVTLPSSRITGCSSWGCARSYKVVREPNSNRTRLFDLRSDPKKQMDLASDLPERTRSYAAWLDAWAQTARASVVRGVQKSAVGHRRPGVARASDSR